MFDFIRHLFIPHSKNNYRSKLLHNSSIVILIFSFLFLSLVSFSIKKSSPQVLGLSYSISDSSLLDEVNKARQKNNLPPLVLNQELSKAASLKAQNMFAENYWAHFSPSGKTPWEFIRSSGYTYVFAGENLAKGFSDSPEIVNAWLNSPTHRDNLLSSKYQDVGFAVTEGKLLGEETVLVVQLFGSKEESIVSKQNTPVTSSSQTQLDKKLVVGKKALGSSSIVEGSFVQSRPKIDLGALSKNVPLIVFSFIAVAFIVDLIVTKKMNIPRAVGHNLDHIFVLVLFIIFLVIQSRGGVL